MAFNLAEKAKDYELNKDTLNIMPDNGFNSEITTSKLTIDFTKKELKELSVGQGLML